MASLEILLIRVRSDTPTSFFLVLSKTAFLANPAFCPPPGAAPPASFLRPARLDTACPDPLSAYKPPSQGHFVGTLPAWLMPECALRCRRAWAERGVGESEVRGADRISGSERELRGSAVGVWGRVEAVGGIAVWEWEIKWAALPGHQIPTMSRRPPRNGEWLETHSHPCDTQALGLLLFTRPKYKFGLVSLIAAAMTSLLCTLRGAQSGTRQCSTPVFKCDCSFVHQSVHAVQVTNAEAGICNHRKRGYETRTPTQWSRQRRRDNANAPIEISLTSKKRHRLPPRYPYARKKDSSSYHIATVPPDTRPVMPLVFL